MIFPRKVITRDFMKSNRNFSIFRENHSGVRKGRVSVGSNVCTTQALPVSMWTTILCAVSWNNVLANRFTTPSACKALACTCISSYIHISLMDCQSFWSNKNTFHMLKITPWLPHKNGNIQLTKIFCHFLIRLFMSLNEIWFFFYTLFYNMWHGFPIPKDYSHQSLHIPSWKFLSSITSAIHWCQLSLGISFLLLSDGTQVISCLGNLLVLVCWKWSYHYTLFVSATYIILLRMPIIYYGLFF